LGAICFVVTFATACGSTALPEAGGDASTDVGGVTDDTGASATVQGTVAGHGLAPAVGIAMVFMQANTFSIYLSDRPSSCSIGTTPYAGETRLDLFAYGPSGGPVALQTYGVGSDGGAFSDAYLHFYDSSCMDTVPEADLLAQEGSVTLTTLTPNVSGSFHLTFAGGTFSGTFDVPVCEATGGADSGSACL
jgi:hypothetical protein